MRDKIIEFCVALVVLGKLVCHYHAYNETYTYEEQLRHFYYLSDFVAHLALFVTFYITGVKKSDRKHFLFIALIYMSESVYYSLYAFKICSFDSGLESSTFFSFELYLSYIFYTIDNIKNSISSLKKWLNYYLD